MTFAVASAPPGSFLGALRRIAAGCGQPRVTCPSVRGWVNRPQGNVIRATTTSPVGGMFEYSPVTVTLYVPG